MKSESKPEQLLTVEEVCERLRVKRSWIYNNPGIPCVRVGRYLRFYWSDVEAYLAQTRAAILGIKRRETSRIIRHSIETVETVESGAQVDYLEWFERLAIGGKIEK